jgi:hypothetical protein
LAESTPLKKILTLFCTAKKNMGKERYNRGKSMDQLCHLLSEVPLFQFLFTIFAIVANVLQ